MKSTKEKEQIKNLEAVIITQDTLITELKEYVTMLKEYVILLESQKRNNAKR